MEHAVSYIRVSTQRQSDSGLGLDAQRSAVEAYCKRQGLKLAREFKEVESGRNNERTVLSEALAFAKQTKSTLVIGKLDRLARNVAFIANLMESGVDFVACDIPGANRLLLHIMAAVAEAEAKAISDRTIAALTAAREHGTALGATNPRSRNLTPEAMKRGREIGSQRTQENARLFYAGVVETIRKLRAEGLSLAAVAEELNASGYRLRSGKPWNAMQVSRALKGAEARPAGSKGGG